MSVSVVGPVRGPPTKPMPQLLIFAGLPGSDGRWDMHVVPGAKTPGGKDKMIVGFAQDRAGELYVLTNTGKGPTGNNGEIWKIVPGN